MSQIVLLVGVNQVADLKILQNSTFFRRLGHTGWNPELVFPTVMFFNSID